ncbi:mdm2-binding isoform X1 [Pelobates cultripes]|uniref:Mdm2-binding isoform X1 n=1 Tax=Pelobates cultripes TaxID=61616 RepID=A0AAD1S2E2_PELCU|nr:mdm2-binding isoform X1 [Pelobates cultripes]
MERFVLVVAWDRRVEEDKKLIPAGFANVQELHNQLKEYCAKYTNTFTACSVTGIPVVRKWFFALHAVYGSFQFCSSDWEDLSPPPASDDDIDPATTTIEECLNAIHNSEEEDEEDSRDSISQTSLFEESAELLHQLSDKLPAPGRALVDVLLLSSHAPKLKDCIPAVGAFKHLKEWHTAKITIATKDSKGWQKISNFLSASVIPTETLKSLIDPQELWRGAIEIHEKKFASEVEFPAFCIRSSDNTDRLCISGLSHVIEDNKDKKRSVLSPEVFHYYGPSLKFVQMVEVSQIPSYFISNCVFELCLTRNSHHTKSKLMLNQLYSLNGKVAAVFMLPCNVCTLPNPPAPQCSSRKWREYMSRKPKEIKIPDVELKGENCGYYFLVQSKVDGICTATMLHSSSQINGAASFSLFYQMLNSTHDEIQNKINTLSCLQHYDGDTIIMREQAVDRCQALAVKDYLQRRESCQHSSPSIADLKKLLVLTREGVFDIFETLNQSTSRDNMDVTRAEIDPADSDQAASNPAEWPERNVLQNLENFEKMKQRIRASILLTSADQLLGRKDGQKEAVTLDAKELLKYFTPQGLAIGELQPLQVQRGDNPFILTPELTPRKLKGLPFEKAATYHYHGLEYCLDNRKALDRDVGFTELQSRLIRYETQTTCTRECCPIPFALSPLASPAVLSEPGSVPDGESLQGDLRADPLRLKRRSKELDGLYASKRFAKSESSDSLMSHTSESSGCQQPCRVTRTRPEKAVFMSSTSHLPSSRSQSLSSKPAPAKQISQPEQENKESRSQKHNRMLKEVVSKTLIKHGIAENHPCFQSCSQRLFEISKFFLKDLKTSRGLLDEMKKAANNNAKQVIQWELDKTKKK